MRHKRVVISKCRIVFFDLEFYVPENCRSKTGFCYNPWDKRCRILGGSFFTANPIKDFDLSAPSVHKKIESHWLWEHGSEKELLQRIYNILKSAHDIVRNAHDGAVSPILCGIGITSSDIPILFDLFRRFEILSNSEAFAFQNNFRAMDLSQLAVATFNNSNHFLYPKTKGVILNKYLPDTKFETGRSVWELYEQKEHEKIRDRVAEEVAATYRCYELIYSDLSRFKSLELTNKKNKKLASKVTQSSGPIPI